MDLVERIRRHYGDGCFACGRSNPLGLHLDGFDVADGWVSAEFTPRPDYRGAGDSLHGGIAATALDEILVWAGILLEDVLTVTGTLQLRYRKPLTVRQPLRLRARPEERSGRRLRIRGELGTPAGSAVEATGIYVVTHTIAELLAGS